MNTTQEDKILKDIGLELMFYSPDKYDTQDGLTSIELAKRLSLNVDVVKKKLKILCDKGIVSVKGINPKIWKFDDYNFQRMDTDDEVYNLLCSFDDVDFSKYFDYSK
ncbi:MAG TPA: hypothetical protein H9673_06405 [Candidatus Adamsella sp.]|nr:hypothetical protein [Candidatus Adamsella sp.]